MANSLILFHSGVGSTKMLAELIEEKLKLDNENNITLLSVENVPNLPELNEFEILIFGFPTYHAMPSKTILNFIDKLPYYETPLHCFAFTTCGLYSSNTLRIFAKHCRRKNLFLLHWQSYRTPATDGTLYAPNIKFLYTAEKNIKHKVNRDIDIFLSRLKEGSFNYKIPRFKLYSIFNYPNAALGRIYQPKIFINKELCVECKKCINLCYYKCLTIDETGVYHNNKNCEHCFRCIHSCPTKALSLIKNNKNLKPLNEKFFINKMKEL